MTSAPDFGGEPLGRRDHIGVGLEARGCRHGDVDASERAGLEEAVGDVVAVAQVGEAKAPERAEVLLEGQQVGERLAGVVAVGERVDDRDRCGGGEPADVVVGVGADDEGAGVAADDSGGVLDGLASAELELVGSDDLRDAAEVADGGAEGEPGAGRRLGEVGDDRVAVEELGVAVRVGADLLADLEQLLEIVGAQVGDAQEVLHGRPSGSGGVTGEGAAHAARAATATAQLAAGDGDDLDAGLAELRVGVDVALVRDDDAGSDGEDVVAVVPLLALGLAVVPAGGEHLDRVEIEGVADGCDDIGLGGDDELVGGVARRDASRPGGLRGRPGRPRTCRVAPWS